MFEMIVQNIGESLVIFENTKMQLANPQFLKLFKNVIIDINTECIIDINTELKDSCPEEEKEESEHAKRGMSPLKLLSNCCIRRVRNLIYKRDNINE
jgi:hypothetical protein